MLVPIKNINNEVVAKFDTRTGSIVIKRSKCTTKIKVDPAIRKLEIFNTVKCKKK